MYAYIKATRAGLSGESIYRNTTATRCGCSGKTIYGEARATRCGCGDKSIYRATKAKKHRVAKRAEGRLVSGGLAVGLSSGLTMGVFGGSSEPQWDHKFFFGESSFRKKIQFHTSSDFFDFVPIPVFGFFSLTCDSWNPSGKGRGVACGVARVTIPESSLCWRVVYMENLTYKITRFIKNVY